MTNFKFGNNSLETAIKLENYPWGFRLKTVQFVWLETTPKKGDRIVRQTVDPRSGKLCAPKCSTYSNVGALYEDEKGHIHWTCISNYTKREQIEKWGALIGLDNLNKEQRKMYNELLGINEVKVDEFTGAKKKDFRVEWVREKIGQGWKDGVWNKGELGKHREVKITFDRPDGVKLKEIFEAMKTLNQTKLNEVFEIREDKHWGDHAGVVRICCRGGVYLGEIKEAEYKNFLASDYNQINEAA